MIDPNVARIVSAALAIVAAAAPGLLAALTSSTSDEEALERAAQAIATISKSPAEIGIQRWREAMRRDQPR